MSKDPSKILTFDQGWKRSIEQDHDSIKEILERLEATTDLHRLLAILDELRTSLVQHFVREEAPDGMYEIIASMSPNTVASLQNVLAEHQDLLGRLDHLRGRIRECVEGPVTVLLGDAAALSSSLHSHEEKETQLFTDAVFNDLGRSS